MQKLNRKLMPGFVKVGRANYRERVNIKRYRDTHSAEEERAAKRAAETKAKRAEAKAKLERKFAVGMEDGP